MKLLDICNKAVKVGSVIFDNNLPLAIIAGPCQMESLQHSIDLAGRLVELSKKYNFPFVFKASFDKANRTSVFSERGVGLDKSLEIFLEIKKLYNIAVTTDVHLPEHCLDVSSVVDLIQIPAFLCRQTDLLKAAALTKLPINVKKAQFLSPWDMQHVIKKLAYYGNKNIMLCERGTCFGYNFLVNDMRALPIMAQFGCPVIFDATHSVQQPGALGGSSGGQREFVASLASAASAIGVAGLFLEIHDDPDSAPSDGPNMITSQEFSVLLDKVLEFDRIAKK